MRKFNHFVIAEITMKALLALNLGTFGVAIIMLVINTVADLTN
tara:strand:- start:82 stop:210 length:129 start_codon:yes stop_codon:yes gene_type:complete